MNELHAAKARAKRAVKDWKDAVRVIAILLEKLGGRAEICMERLLIDGKMIRGRIDAVTKRLVLTVEDQPNGQKDAALAGAPEKKDEVPK